MSAMGPRASASQRPHPTASSTQRSTSRQGRLVPPLVVEAQDHDSRPHLLEDLPPPEGVGEGVHGRWIEGSMGPEERGAEALHFGTGESEDPAGRPKLLLGPHIALGPAEAGERADRPPSPRA